MGLYSDTRNNSLSGQLYTLLLILAFACLLNLISFAGVVYAEDWYKWRGPNSNGISSEKDWSSTWDEGKPNKLWEASVGIGFAAVSIRDGRAYTLGNADKFDTIYCFDANTGDEIWKYSYPCVAEGGGHPGTAGTPYVDEKYVYTLSREGHIHCLDAKSGELIWSDDMQKTYSTKPPSWQFASSPLVLGDKVIIHVGIVLAFDKLTGNLIWKTKDYGGGYSTPYVFDMDGIQKMAVFNTLGLVILDPETGQELMQQPWHTDQEVKAVTPIISDGKVFVSCGYGIGGALIQIDGDKPVIIWESKKMRNHFNSCVLWGGYLYGFDESELKCMDFQTSMVKWGQEGLGKSSLMIADKKLIIQTEKGDLVIAEASPESYKEITRAKVLDGLCWTVPVLSNSKIYCRSHEGRLVCLDVSKGN